MGDVSIVTVLALNVYQMYLKTGETERVEWYQSFLERAVNKIGGTFNPLCGKEEILTILLQNNIGKAVSESNRL